MGQEFINADEIRTATFVRHIEIHDTLGSTNDRAAELAREKNVALPALVVARHQTAGRGRGMNVWQAAEGALTFSLLLEPASLGISTANWPQLSLATAVAVCDALAKQLEKHSYPEERAGASSPPAGLGDEPARCEANNDRCAESQLTIKWPNDVLLNGRKICGILIESPGGPPLVTNRLIIGVGINVNNSWQSPSNASAILAIALCDVVKEERCLQEILIETLRTLANRIQQLAANDVRLPAAWQRLSWLKDRRIEVVSDDRRTKGLCLGIDANAELLIQDGANLKRVRSGTVRLA